MTRFLPILLAALLIGSPAGAQQLFGPGQGGGGGSVSLSSGNTNTLTVSPNPITGTGTISTTASTADCSSGTGACTSGAIVTGLNGDLIYLGGGNTYTLAQAGSAGFTTGWGACLVNVSASGNATVNATTSVFKGASNSTSLVLAPGQWGCIQSDGTNYGTAQNPPAPAPLALSWGPSQNLSTAPIDLVTFATARTLTGVTCHVVAAVGGTATIDVYIAASGTAYTSGTKVTTTSCNANGTANTSQTGLASAAVAVPAGDSVGVVAAGAGWPGAGSGSVSVSYQ